MAKGVRVARPYWLLLLGVFLAVAFRLAYVFVWWLEPTAWVARAVTSRTAIIAATATLAMLLWSWIQAVHGQFAHGTRVFFLVTQISLTTVTAVLALSMFVVGVVEAATFAPAATSARIVIDFLIIAVLVTFGFAFLLYGIILFVMLRRSELSARRDQAVSVIVISIFIFCGYAMSLTGLWQNAVSVVSVCLYFLTFFSATDCSVVLAGAAGRNPVLCQHVFVSFFCYAGGAGKCGTQWRGLGGASIVRRRRDEQQQQQPD